MYAGSHIIWQYSGRLEHRNRCARARRLRRALSSAVALIGGGAGVLALNDTGATEEAEAASRSGTARWPCSPMVSVWRRR